MEEEKTNVGEESENVDEENPAPEEISEPRRDESQPGRRKRFTKAHCRQLLAGCAVTTFSFSLGNALGWSSPALPKLESNYSETDLSWISSVLPLGAAFACFYSGILVDKLGRRFTMLIQTIPFLLGWIMLTIGGSFPVYLIGRFILGMAGGAICMSVPVYVNEISLPEIRGKLGTLFQVSITFGILHIYLLGKHSTVSLLSGISIIFPILALVTVYFLPESPSFYAAKGKFDNAEKSLKWFLKSENVDSEMKDLAELTSETNLSLMATLKSKSGLRATLVILGLMFVQQFSGINVVIFFSADVFEAAKTSISKYDCIIIVGLTQWLSTIVANSLVDSTGRRPLMLISLIGMTLTQIALATYFTCPSHYSAKWLPLFSVCVYIISFSFGAGPLPWSMLGELLPPSAKGSISSLAVVFNWLLAFVVTVSFTGMRNAVGDSFPFWLYSSVCCIGVVVTYIYLPETKGKKLVEIHKILEKGRVVRAYQ